MVVVYTSDHGHGHGHGQGLGENDNHSTHCLPRTCAGCAGPRASGTDELWGGAGEFAFSPQVGQAYSQFQIFPSLLHLMGYQSEEVQGVYGPNLSQPWQGERVFFSGDLWGRGQLSRNRFDFEEDSVGKAIPTAK